ncbi:conserved hypothetical protein [Streptomyces pristinaespiralis ATCC 25486]|uniref:Uncharacterized protein n=2 Tax=Streptomyces pristinaespiralis TaxID=38300 RepID=B5HJ93_STRE2|nr:conserved hypothetical protein [Streptomyces pristinaespiralis ATCC 25486]
MVRRHPSRPQAESPFALPLGGSMVLLALCVPILMMLLLLGMEAFEDLVSRPSPNPRTSPDDGDEEMEGEQA